MKTFDVYKLWPIEPIRAKGTRVWDIDNNEYLDFYGGHAVISVGHCHPVYNKMISTQLEMLSFYSNSVLNSLQTELSERLGRVSDYPDYSLFLSNSGAEANENAIKLASFYTGKSRVLSFKGAFHGRTSGAVAMTDNPSIVSPFNSFHHVTFATMNDIEGVKAELSKGDYAAVIIEGIQGVAGIYTPDTMFMKALRSLTTEMGVVLIVDEVQSGYARTGKFFAHQHSGIKADIVTTAKGMGNGFPIGGTLISPIFKAVPGMLGSTFGGSHLACAAAIAVLKIIEDEGLMERARVNGYFLKQELNKIRMKYSGVISDIRGEGLMVGIEMVGEFTKTRDMLLFNERVFTGGAKSNIIRLLPPLTVTEIDITDFTQRFEKCIINILESN
ncbi:MAG: aminotransferase class III-fold pyridoxal phosphate-dependent enzyme [Bacteroidales bacterium]|nr:aminotransferase class III-fold pyridoxal phosphate-dependent enzyme [Bacteroidales bacterium]